MPKPRTSSPDTVISHPWAVCRCCACWRWRIVYLGRIEGELPTCIFMFCGSCVAELKHWITAEVRPLRARKYLDSLRPLEPMSVEGDQTLYAHKKVSAAPTTEP